MNTTERALTDSEMEIAAALLYSAGKVATKSCQLTRENGRLKILERCAEVRKILDRIEIYLESSE